MSYACFVTVSKGKRTQSTRSTPVDGLLTTAEVAELANVSEQTVRRWRYDGDLPFFRLGYRTVRYQRDDVVAMIVSTRRTST